MIIDAVGFLLWQPDRDQKPTAVIGDFTTEHLNQRQVPTSLGKQGGTEYTCLFCEQLPACITNCSAKPSFIFSKSVELHSGTGNNDLILEKDFSFKITLSYI